MKKQFLWAALAATTLFGTSCSNNDEPKPENEGNEVTFVIGGINSRTTTDFTNNLSASFVDGDKIGLFASGDCLQEAVTNTELTYSGTTLTSSAIKFKDDATQSDIASFKAYYPYQAGSSTEFEFSVETDQSSVEKFNASDFVVAEASGAKGSQVTLNFNHKMALIKLTLDTSFTNNLEDGETIKSITLNANPTATINLTNTPSVTAKTGVTAANIKMYAHTDGTYYCIIPAQTITGNASAALLTITTSTRAFVYNFTGSKEFSANQTHPIKIMNGTVFSFSSVSIAGWGTTATEENWGVNETAPEPETLLANQSFDNITITSAPSWAGSTGAWSFVAGTNAVVQITTEGAANNALNLKSSEEVKSSWAQCIAYYTIENPKNTLYKISFKAKTDNTATKGLCFSALYKTTTNYVAIYNAPKNVGEEGYYTGMVQCNVTAGNEYKDYSIIIDLTKTVTTRNTTKVTPTDTSNDDKEKIFFTLYPATGGGANDVNFYVDDLKIEQIFSIE